MDEKLKTNPATDSGTAALNEIIAQRRKEQGITDAYAPKAIAFPSTPLRELLPEQVAEREAHDAKQALTQQRAERQGMFTKLTMATGSRYSDCTLDRYEIKNERQQKAVDAVREYAATILERISEVQGLVFYGPAGTGKDHLAFFVAASAIVNHGKAAIFINGQDWFGDLRDGMDDGTKERSVIDRLAWAPLLILSDPLPPFGDLTQHQASMLYRLVNARYSRGNPTICTVNVASDDEADKRMGVQTWDRLCHGAWKIKCAWPSYRKPARVVNAK